MVAARWSTKTQPKYRRRARIGLLNVQSVKDLLRVLLAREDVGQWTRSRHGQHPWRAASTSRLQGWQNFRVPRSLAAVHIYAHKRKLGHSDLNQRSIGQLSLDGNTPARPQRIRPYGSQIRGHQTIMRCISPMGERFRAPSAIFCWVSYACRDCGRSGFGFFRWTGCHGRRRSVR
jgi:hypothetical protein